MDNIATYLDLEDLHNNADEQCISGEREEWMYLAELNCGLSDHTTTLSEDTHNYCEGDISHYSPEQIGNMPTWIETQQDSVKIDSSSHGRIINVASLNEYQTVAYNLVHHHFTEDSSNPLLMIITGLAGSGKSYVIDTFRNLLKDKLLHFLVLLHLMFMVKLFIHCYSYRFVGKNVVN